MKCIKRNDSKGAIDRVDEDAAFLAVSRGQASYTTKVLWKKFTGLEAKVDRLRKNGGNVKKDPSEKRARRARCNKPAVEVTKEN